MRRDDGSCVERMSGEMMALQHFHFGSARSSCTGFSKKEAYQLWKKRVGCGRERWKDGAGRKLNVEEESGLLKGKMERWSGKKNKVRKKRSKLTASLKLTTNIYVNLNFFN